LLKEDDSISPIYNGFSMIIRRNFFKKDDGLTGYYIPVDSNLQKAFKQQKDDPQVWIINLPVSARLYYLKKYRYETYEKVCNYFKAVFPFISDIEIKDIKEINPSLRTFEHTPVFCIRERNVNTNIPYNELSSGMQKVLLILTDVFTMPIGSVYLIDEYENSLGINAIDFFPSVLDEVGNDYQFIITSHHPYLINNISSDNWYVFHREGSSVQIKYGEENRRKYGKSKLESFTQLINDPFFFKGAQ
jgi:hypothetical protein